MNPVEPTPVNILVVDDHPANLTALASILARPDYRLVTATTGVDALRLALGEEFVLVLLDVMMPGMDGFEVASHLKTLERTRHVPIVFLTGVATDLAQIHRAYAVGGVDYLVKPLDTEIVRQKVAVFVDLARQREEIARQGEEIARQERLLRESARREYENRLAELRLASDTRYRKLVAGINHAVAWSAHPEALTLSFVSRQAERILGYTAEQLAAPGFFLAHVHPDDRELVLATIREAVAAGDDQMCNHRMVAADGRVLWFHTGVSFDPPREGAPAELHGISVEVTDLKRAERDQRLLAEVSALLSASLEDRVVLEKLARLAVPEMADGCLVDLVDPAGEVRQAAAAYVAPEEERLARELGQGPPEAPLERGVARVLRAGRPEVFPALADDIGAAGAPGPEPPALPRALGAGAYLCVPLTARGQVLGAIRLVRAGPARRYTAAELALAEELARRTAIALDNARLYADAREAIRLRDEFLSIAAHELRTPLTSLQLGLDLLLRAGSKPGAEPQLGPRLEAAARQAQRLSKLVESLLDVSRLTSGRMPLQREELDLGEMAREVLGRFAAEARVAGCELALRAAGPAVGRWDRLRVEQILSNLLSNALKYGAGKPVEVGVDASGGQARLSVRDFGIGIAPEDAARIFQRFERAVSARHYGGLGLGLYIARQLAAAHGGAIAVESQPGAGALFTVTLPLRAEAESPTNPRPPGGGAG